MTTATDLRITLPTPNFKVEQLVEGRSHFYGVTLDDGTKHKFGGVTGVLGIIAKPALVNWAASEAAKNAEKALVARLGGKKSAKITLTEKWISEVIAESKKKHEKIKDEAAGVGTKCHEYFDKFIRGEELPDVTNEIWPAIKAFRVWFESSNLSLVAGDTDVASLAYEYGGALDAIAVDEHGDFVLVDFKTSKGVYSEYGLQVAAYANALEETYGIQCRRAVILRFSKTEPAEFEVKEVLNIKQSFQAFLLAKSLQWIMKKEHFV